MSQLAHPAITTRVRSTRSVLLAALLALAAVAAIALVIALGNDTATSDQAGVAQTQSSVRADSGPDESTVAASVGSSATAGPDESAVAASVAAGSTQPTGGPDESTVAAAVSGR